MYKNLDDWLHYIEQRYICQIDLGLERIRKVADGLKLTSFSCPVVVIAGTNGKGSCVAYLESILSAAGYKVGSYTSPHLLRFNERIHINGEEIDDQSLCNAFAVVDKICKDARLTYFEFITLAALYIFQLKPLDILLLEVGLGGRLDAVNLVDADIAVITTIAVDHAEYLGNDRELIGYEKAGIMRSNKPVVCGDSMPPKSVVEHTKTLKAPLYCLGQEFGYSITNDNSWQWYSKDTKLDNLPLPNLSLQSAATSIMVVSLLRSRLPIVKDAILSGLPKAFLPGRCQHLSCEREIILDVAHNPEASAFLVTELASLPKRRTLAVFGMLKDKDILGTLQPLLPQVSTWYLGDLNVPRGATAEHLMKYLKDLGQQQCYTYETILQAYNQAVANCTKKDRILVFGSFYTVAEVLKEGINHGYTY